MMHEYILFHIQSQYHSHIAVTKDIITTESYVPTIFMNIDTKGLNNTLANKIQTKC